MTRRIVWTGVPVKEKLNITGRGTVLVVDIDKCKEEFEDSPFRKSDFIEFESDLYQIISIGIRRELSTRHTITGVELTVREA